MSDSYMMQAAVTEEDDRTVIDLGYLCIEIVKYAQQRGPLNPTGDDGKSGATFWENEYIKGEGTALEYGGGPLIAKAELDDHRAQKILEKLSQSKEIGESQ